MEPTEFTDVRKSRDFLAEAKKKQHNSSTGVSFLFLTTEVSIARYLFPLSRFLVSLRPHLDLTRFYLQDTGQTGRRKKRRNPPDGIEKEKEIFALVKDSRSRYLARNSVRARIFFPLSKGCSTERKKIQISTEKQRNVRDFSKFLDSSFFLLLSFLQSLSFAPD